MTSPMQSPTTISNIAVAMFTIADQDAAIAYYTQTLGWELRADIAFGDEGGNRWVEVAPPGSIARLALNPPMDEWQPGGSAIGVATPDVNGEHARVAAIGAVTTTELMATRVVARPRPSGCRSRRRMRRLRAAASRHAVPLRDTDP